MNLNSQQQLLASIWPQLLIIVCVVTALSYIGVRLLIRYLIQTGMVDRVNERSMHQGEVPRGGGLVIVFFIFFALVGLAVTSARPLFFTGLSLCIAAWAILSWCDDRYDLSPISRLVIQLLISIATVMLFGWVNLFLGFSLGWLGPVLSVIGLLWMANLNNFMDGMDGMAASQAIIASVTLGIWFLFLGDQELAFLCVVIGATNYGFLLLNWQPARIFMGDVGSITLGAIYGTLIIIAANRYNIPVLSLALIFAVFIADTSYTLLNRARKGEAFWKPHRSHFYQRAGLAGIKHSHVVLMAIVLMMLCSLIATLSVLYRDIIVWLVLITLVVLVATATGVIVIERKAEQERKPKNIKNLG